MEVKATNTAFEPYTHKQPDFEGLIDEDILERFKDSSVFYGDIINAQMIKTNKELIEAIRVDTDARFKRT